jgi:hypothetical protein
MSKLIRIAIVCAALTATANVLADDTPQHHPHDPGVNARQHRQAERIRQGVRSGELTKSETQQLNQERRGIRQEERADKADGKLTAAERKDLHQDLNNLSKDIHTEKHDAEKRP